MAQPLPAAPTFASCWGSGTPCCAMISYAQFNRTYLRFCWHACTQSNDARTIRLLDRHGHTRTPVVNVLL